MSRKLVLVGVFLTVLPLVAISAKVRGGEPPKVKAAADSNPFGGGNDVVKPQAAKPTTYDVVKPKAVKPTVDVDADRPFAATANKSAQASKPARQSKGQAPRLPKLRGGEQAILKALKEQTTIEFVETPLKDVLDYLSYKHRIPIRMDGSALKEAGVDDSTPVTCNLSGISLHSALEIILDELQLKWAIHHEVLMITSPAKAESDEFRYTKSYDVTDLLEQPADHEQQSPLTSSARSEDASGNPPVCYLPSAGDIPGTSAMSFPRRATTAEFDMQALKDVITNLVNSRTWVENGGTGTLASFGHLLAITQTREVHMQIEQLLAQLRARRRAVPTLSVELHWLWLDAKHRDRLLAGRGKPAPGERSLAVDPQDLKQLASEVPGFHGQVACASGIGTVLAAGDRRSVMTSAIPVVGGENCVGYQPVIAMPNVGAAARLRATCDAGRKMASLDIVSLITRWDSSQKPAIIGSAWPAQRHVASGFTAPALTHAPGGNAAGTAAPPAKVAPAQAAHATAGGSATCPVDRPVMPTQQIAATLRVPLGQPVVVGSMTLDPEGNAGLGAAREDANEVFLVATVSIVREAKR